MDKKAKKPAATSTDAPKTPKKNPVEREKDRLLELYKEVPEGRLKLLDGLIDEAARYRVRLDALWADLVENGETELFTQSPNTPPYERARPAAQIYTQAVNAYKNLISTLDAVKKEYPDDGGDLMDFLKDFDEEYPDEGVASPESFAEYQKRISE